MMTATARAMMRLLSETKIANETISIAMMGGPTVTLTDIEIDEETGVIVGTQIHRATWPIIKYGVGDLPNEVAKTFTGRIDLVVGFFA